MTFTTTPPTVPGFYVWKPTKDSELQAIILSYDKSLSQLCRMTDRGNDNVPRHGEWCRLVPADEYVKKEEVEKAYREGWMHRDKYNYRDCDTIFKSKSRAKQVAEGTI
jgi:hypothetical protein